MSECELCGESENYCSKCSTCHDCIDRERGETAKELERLRTENEELKEGLTASYMLGSENGKDSAKAEIAGLKQERDRLRAFSNIVDGINPLTLQKAKMVTEKGYRVAGFYLEKTGDDKCFIQHAHVTWVRDEEA